MAQQQIVHPMINLLVDTIREIKTLYINGNYVAAWRIMKDTIERLKPEDKRQPEVKKLKQTIQNCLEHINKKQGLTPLDKYTNETHSQNKLLAGKAEKIQEDFTDILWKYNYLTNEGYGGMYYPASDRQ